MISPEAPEAMVKGWLKLRIGEPSTVTAVTSKKVSPAASISSWSIRSGALPLE